MAKLSEDFETYVEILRHLRTSYFHLCTRMGEGELFHLLRCGSEESETTAGWETGKAETDTLVVETLYDRFLDAFSRWKKERSAEAHAGLVRCARDLREADPDFRFQLPPETEAVDGEQDRSPD